jgi:hypothetical protein
MDPLLLGFVSTGNTVNPSLNASGLHLLKKPQVTPFANNDFQNRKPFDNFMLYVPEACPENLDFFGTRFARCHFGAQQSLGLQGPPLPMALKMAFSPSLRPAAPYKKQVHL